MQLGWSRFSHSERHRWLTAKVCLYCRQPGHFITQVGQKTKLTSRYRRNGEQSFFLFHTCPFDNTWFSPLVWWLTCLFFYSGADDPGAGPLDEDLSEPKTIHDLNVEILIKVAHQTAPLNLIISGNHREQIQLFLIPASSSGVLHSPWLACHNPQFDWLDRRLASRSVSYHTNCPWSALSRSPVNPDPLLVAPDLSIVPAKYHILGEVFSKQHALSLLPHQYPV